MSHKTLFLTIFSALIITACSSANTEDNSLQGQLSTKTQSQSTSTATDRLDQDFIYKAVNQDNPQLCDTVSSEANKNLCYQLVKDHSLLDQAISSQSKDLCSQILDSNLQQRCFLSLQIIVERQQQQANQQKELDKIPLIVQSQDPSRCQELQDPNFIQACQFNIYLDLTHQNQDTKYCDNISDLELQKFCQNLY